MKGVKYIFGIVICVLIVIGSQKLTISQGSWQQMDIPTTKNLNSVAFIDSLAGWVVGDSGIILHTSDGGESWEFQESNTINNIIDVFFIDDNYGWATSHSFSSLPYGSLLLKTSDGGNNWDTTTYYEDNIFITTIYFFDSLTGWMGGTPHALVKTIDGGQTWHQATIDTSTLAFFPVLNIEFYNEQNGYASGGIFDIAGVIWRTSDGGNNWFAIDPSDAPADEVHGLFTFDSINVIGSGGDPDFGFGVGMIKTTDGNNWDYDEIGVQGIAYDIDFVTESEGWAPLGFENKFVYSTDSGNSWIDIPTPDETSIFDIVFPDSLHGFAVGWEGAFLKYLPGDPVMVEENTMDGIYISQNYPNPAVHNTRIDINISAIVESEIYLVILDVMGREVVRTIPDFSGNKYSAVIDSYSLPNGIYYYYVQYGDRYSKKLTMELID